MRPDNIKSMEGIDLFMTNTILHIVLNSFQNDSRVLKAALAAKEYFPSYDVEIIAVHSAGLLEHETLQCGVKVWRVKLVTKKWPNRGLWQFPKYIEWFFKIIYANKSSMIRLVHCHNLTAVPIGLFFKVKEASLVLLDAHELFSHQYSTRKVQKKLVKIIENLVIRKVDGLITVSDGIKNWYVGKYNISNCHVIRNIPEYIVKEELRCRLRDDCGIPKNALVFGYIGGLSRNRLILEILESYHESSSDSFLVFMGSGPLMEIVMKYAEIDSRIRYHQAVASLDVVEYAKGIDIGFALSNTYYLNSKLSLPNKLFQYIEAGVPFVVAQGSSREEYIEEKDIGWSINISSSEAIQAFISSVDISILQRKKNK